MSRFSSAVLALVLTALPAAAQSPILLTLEGQVNLSSTANSGNPQFIGSNPSAVAWDGTSLWVGGYNNSGATNPTAVTRVTDVFGSPAFGPAFGSFSTANTRGITGLAVQGTTLAVALDNGAGSGDAVRAFDTTDPTAPTLRWRIGDPAAGNDSTRRASGGAAFDPGFNGAGTNQGVTSLLLGSGRRSVIDPTTGVFIQTPANGAIINLTPVSTTWRDVAFDPATGDLYARESNRLTKAVRTADNAFQGGGSTIIGTLDTAAAVDNQNLSFADLTASAIGAKVLFLNDRTAATAGQPFGNVVKAFDTDGNAVTLQFSGFDPTTTTGNGAYDFAYHAGTETLAVTDFAGRQVYIFSVAPVPEPVGLLAVAAVGLVGLRRVRRRA